MTEDRTATHNLRENWYSVGPLGTLQSVRENFAGSQFSGVVLENADFKQTLLTGADFSGAVLTNANFANADLEDALMCSADLEDANFEGADLCGADFRFANIGAARFDGAVFDARTVLPFDRGVAEEQHKMIYRGQTRLNN